MTVGVNGTLAFGSSQPLTISSVINGAGGVRQSGTGTTTLTGTASLDMGDGPPPTGGLSFTGTLTSTGLSITVAGNTIPTLPKTDGFTRME